MLSNCGAEEDPWQSLGQQGDQTSQCLRNSTLHIHWKDWRWSWSSNTSLTWCEESTQRKRPWCWERLRAGGEGGSRGWDGWVASPTQWTWIWANSGRYWGTGKPGVLQSMGSQRVGHDLPIEQQQQCPEDCRREMADNAGFQRSHNKAQQGKESLKHWPISESGKPTLLSPLFLTCPPNPQGLKNQLANWKL